jgi:hypothetical protein
LSFLVSSGFFSSVIGVLTSPLLFPDDLLSLAICWLSVLK